LAHVDEAIQLLLDSRLKHHPHRSALTESRPKKLTTSGVPA
jgi:hypothetical protein